VNEELASLTVIFTEFYYWVTVVFMFLIHVGLCLYEVGASRRQHHLTTLMMKTMVPPVVTVTFFFFGLRPSQWSRNHGRRDRRTVGDRLERGYGASYGWSRRSISAHG
jgi:hypothetical protein